MTSRSNAKKLNISELLSCVVGQSVRICGQQLQSKLRSDATELERRQLQGRTITHVTYDSYLFAVDVGELLLDNNAYMPGACYLPLQFDTLDDLLANVLDNDETDAHARVIELFDTCADAYRTLHEIHAFELDIICSIRDWGVRVRTLHERATIRSRTTMITKYICDVSLQRHVKQCMHLGLVYRSTLSLYFNDVALDALGLTDCLINSRHVIDTMKRYWMSFVRMRPWIVRVHELQSYSRDLITGTTAESEPSNAH